MACFHPITGYRPRHGAGLVFNTKDGYADREVRVACNNCVGCRIDRSRAWATRCLHEAKMHDVSMCVTLTYDNEKLPEGGTLVKKHFRDFIKRLRQHCWRKHKKKIRFFHCGEYGENLSRPHYHALIFGHWMEDARFWKQTKKKANLYRSSLLDKIWGHGLCSIDTVTFTSASYCAGYIFKKVSGERAAQHYGTLDPETGELVQRQAEYITMSTNPGIGATFYEKYGDEIHRHDNVITNGKTNKVPKFYDKLLKRRKAETLEAIKKGRLKRALGKSVLVNSKPERLATREKVTKARINLNKRSEI